MNSLNDIIEIYKKAISVDYSVYNHEFGDDFGEGFESFIPRLKSTTTDAETMQISIGLMMCYFLHLTKTGGVYCDEKLIKKEIGHDLTEMVCNINEQPVYNIDRTYWILKVLIFHSIIAEENEELSSSIAFKALQEIEMIMSTYFFPTMGGAGISHADRQKNTKLELASINIYSNKELEQIFTQMPLYKSSVEAPSIQEAHEYFENYFKGKPQKSGCFIATATFGTPLAYEVIILKNWRDNWLLKTDLGKNFVKFYYVLSPTIANYIRKSNVLKMLMLYALKPIIKLLK